MGNTNSPKFRPGERVAYISGDDAILGRVAGMVTTTGDPYELARAARALRALGRSQEANAAYRDAAAGLARDPAVHTGWGELFLEKLSAVHAWLCRVLTLFMV